MTNDARKELWTLIIEIDSIYRYQLFTIEGLTTVRRMIITNTLKSELRLEMLSTIYESLLLAGATREMLIGHIQSIFDTIIQDVNLYEIYKDIIPPHVEKDRLKGVYEIYGPLIMQVFIAKVIGLNIISAIEPDLIKERDDAIAKEAEAKRKEKMAEFYKKYQEESESNDENKSKG